MMKTRLLSTVLWLLCSCVAAAEPAALAGPGEYLHDISPGDVEAIISDSGSKDIQRKVASCIVVFPLAEAKPFIQVVTPFGKPRKQYQVDLGIEFHLGVDIDSPIGTPVKAAGSGTVVARGMDDRLGFYVVVDHGNSIKSIYGHLSGFARLQGGAQVGPGQIIGYVGITGLLGDPCLYFAIVYKGKYLDPERALPMYRWTN